MMLESPRVFPYRQELRQLRVWFEDNLPAFVRKQKDGHRGRACEWASWAESVEVLADAAEAAGDVRKSRHWARVAGRLYQFVVRAYLDSASSSSAMAVAALPFDEKAIRCFRRGRSVHADRQFGTAREFLCAEFEWEGLRTIPFHIPRLERRFDVRLVGMPRVLMAPHESVVFAARLEQEVVLRSMHISSRVAYSVSVSDLRFESDSRAKELTVPGVPIPGPLFSGAEFDSEDWLNGTSRTYDRFVMTVTNERDREIDFQMAMQWRAA